MYGIYYFYWKSIIYKLQLKIYKEQKYQTQSQVSKEKWIELSRNTVNIQKKQEFIYMQTLQDKIQSHE